MVTETAVKSETIEPQDKSLTPTVRLKILLLQNSLKAADLARRLDLSPGYVQHLISGQQTTKAGRRAIENFFGVKIWSEPDAQGGGG